MLSRVHRMTRAEDFHEAVRRGVRAGSPTVVLHLAVLSDAGATPGRIGFIVNKSVGSAVVRTRTKRRLRHLCRELAPRLPNGGLLVVRAAPAAAAAPTAALAGDLETCLQRVLRKTGPVAAT